MTDGGEAGENIISKNVRIKQKAINIERKAHEFTKGREEYE